MFKVKNIVILLTVLWLSFYTLIYKKEVCAPEKKHDENFLRVGTCADFPPYEKIDRATRKVVGFDIDVIQEVAARLGKKIKLKDMPFNSLILNLATGKIDVVAAALSITEDRKAVISFSDLYLYNDYAIIVTPANKPPLENLCDLHGKTVGICPNYAANKYVTAVPGIRIVEFCTLVDNAYAFQNGSIDAFATSKNRYNRFLNQHSHNDAFQYFIIPNTAEHCAFALGKNNHTLRKQINAALADMTKDGTLQKIKNSWGFHD